MCVAGGGEGGAGGGGEGGAGGGIPTPSQRPPLLCGHFFHSPRVAA